MPRVAVLSPLAPRPEFTDLDLSTIQRSIQDLVGGGLDVVDLGGGLVCYLHRSSKHRGGMWFEGRYIAGNFVICRISEESIVLSLTEEDEQRILRHQRLAVVSS